MCSSCPTQDLSEQSARRKQLDLRLAQLTRTVVVAQVLCVLIFAELILSEDVTPWRPATSDLRLKAAQVWEISNVGVGEAKVAMKVAVDAFGDSRQVQVIPGCEVVTTAIVVVCRTRV